MLKIANHISELLLTHDCVIIPHFGGFVGNYSPAKMNKVKHLFLPPSKEISFNKNLIHNDGLLANSIAQKENLTYADANTLIKQEVENIHQKLRTGEKVILKDIGSLFFDTNQHIQFEPEINTNFLIDSFGLSAFHVQPIKREEEKVKPLKSRKSIATPNTPLRQKKAFRVEKKTIVTMVALMPLLIYVMWLLFYTDFNKEHFQYSDLNPFTKKICPSYQQRHFSPFDTGEDKKEDRLQLASLPKTTTTIQLSFFDKQNPEFADLKDITIKVSDITKAEPISTYVSTAEPKAVSRYHIIGGCFQYQSNAKRLVKKLQNKGFADASIIGKYHGLYRVSYQGFVNKEEALKELHSIKNNHLSSAWLLSE